LARLNPAREPDASGSRARNLMFAPEPTRHPRDRPHPPRALHEPAGLDISLRRDKSFDDFAPHENTPAAPHHRGCVWSPFFWQSKVEITCRLLHRRWTLSAITSSGAPAEVLTEDQLKRLKKETPPLAEPSAGRDQTHRPIQNGSTMRAVRETKFSTRRLT